MENETLRRTCFICGSAGGVAAFPQDYSVCGLGRVHYALRCCDGCGLTLQDPAISPATMMRQYSLFSNYLAFGEGDPALSATAGRMLEFLAEARVPAGRVYDIGASTGAMLWHFRKQGWAVGGCDLSQLAVDQARALNHIALDYGDCQDTLPRNRGVDLVTLSHVLEHIYEPVAVLRAVWEALAETGRLMFEVPCLIAPERNPAGLFTMEHVNFFEQTAIENLLGMVGFRLERAVVTLDHSPYPVITVLAAKAARPDGPPAIRNVQSENLEFLRAFNLVEQSKWDAADARIRAALTPSEPVYVWGAGIHTSMLLVRTSLERHAAILGVTDRDAQKHGQFLGDHRVVDPAAALESGRKIVISSYASEAAIAEGLMRQGLAADRIVRLYT